MNNVSLIGRTTNDIELKTTPNGKSVVNFTLAVKRPFTKDTTDFVICVAWGNQADVLSRFVHKGNQVAVVGNITTRNYEDKEGNKRSVTEVLVNDVVLLSNEKKTSQNEPQSKTQGFTVLPESSDPYIPFESNDDDSLPF
jgi:single-strand DNA-binding protein